MLLGLALGLLTRPESVFESFYEPLFRGFLSILMLVMGMEAWSRLGELRKVAQWYAVYAFIAPLLHGFIAFGLGMIAHYVTGFSPGGVALLAIIAASSSDISGPPTLRAGIPSANPSAYIGSSTAIGTPWRSPSAYHFLSALPKQPWVADRKSVVVKQPRISIKVCVVSGQSSGDRKK